jgi:2,3-bisphosphoglycerate-independent phosphoglycerate mutase
MRPIVLVIMDGFGLSTDIEGNAIAAAKKPNIERIWKDFGVTTLKSSGLAVGLPEGQMGNSEVGHLNLGAGRIVYQIYTRINLAVETGAIEENPVLKAAMDSSKRLHMIGLLSDGGVHSHISHLFALLQMARDLGKREVYVHAILDGRDVPPRSALTYFEELKCQMDSLGLGKVATVSGRYYTMDRDKRWERIELSYRMLTEGSGFSASTPEEAVLQGYQRGENDEFLKPTVVDPEGLIKNGDSIIFFNFRPDRAREITRTFVDKSFSEFQRPPLKVNFTCLALYDATLDAPVAFPPQNLDDTLGEVVSCAGKRQLRTAETEKYAHVTYFFNGGKEVPNPGEDRAMVPSPKVATYDLKPEMSAREVTDGAVQRIKSGAYDLVIMNYANPDMVGHTGVFKAAVEAIEVVDECVGQIAEATLGMGGALLLTADHGNAEKMLDLQTGQPHTAHTTNPVPFTLATADGTKMALREEGILSDVAPTVLELMGLSQPKAMTGISLIKGQTRCKI